MNLNSKAIDLKEPYKLLIFFLKAVVFSFHRVSKLSSEVIVESDLEHSPPGPKDPNVNTGSKQQY